MIPTATLHRIWLILRRAKKQVWNTKSSDKSISLWKLRNNNMKVHSTSMSNRLMLTILFLGCKVLWTLLLINPFAICSTLLVTFSSTTGSHLLLTRFLGVDTDEKGLKLFTLLHKKHDERKQEIIRTAPYLINQSKENARNNMDSGYQNRGSKLH